jgi:hypothetical protein
MSDDENRKRIVRDFQIALALAGGVSVKDVAETHWMSISAVRRIYSHHMLNPETLPRLYRGEADIALPGKAERAALDAAWKAHKKARSIENQEKWAASQADRLAQMKADAVAAKLARRPQRAA